LIDASGIYSKMRKGLGSKSNELTESHIQQIADAFKEFQQNEISRIFENDDFAYWSITVERPLRLAWQLTDERLSSIEDIDFYLPILRALQKQFGNEVQTDFNQLLSALDGQLKKLSLKWKPKEKKTFLDALSWRDEEAKPVIKKQEKDEVIYEADPELRDYESVPVKQDVQKYFEKEVWPFVPDAWIDHAKTVKGYEISFTKIFYKYQPLRSVDDIANEIMQLEKETDGLLKQIIE
jgi:type I restriction enzyme M protein